MTNGEKPRLDWIQFGILLLSILTAAMYHEGRLARIEQQLEDGKRDRDELLLRLQRDEDQWQHSHLPYHSSPLMQ